MLESLLWRARLETTRLLRDVRDDESGDTNFISILIILGIVILLAGTFMGFRDQIVGQVQEIINGFTIH